MSRFQPDRLRIGVGKDGLALVKTAGWRTTKILADQWLPLVSDDEHSNLANSLATALATPGLKSARADVILADTLVRYLVVDRPKGLRDIQELESLIHTQFEAQFGLPVADWTITADLAPIASHDLVCAAPRALLSALTGSLQSAKVRVESVRPFFVNEAWRWRRSLMKTAHWFVATLGDDYLTAYRDHTGWRGIQIESGAQVTGRPIADTVRQVALRLGLPVSAPIMWAGACRPPVDNSSGVMTVDLPEWPGRSAQWSKHHRAALSGLWPCSA